MSNPEVGEAFVKIRPLVGDDFPQQVEQQVNQGIKRAQDTADRMVDEVTKRISDLQLRAEAATLRGQNVQASRFEAQAQLEQVIFAAQQARAEAAAAVGSDQAAFRDLLLASAEAYERAADKLQGMIARSQATGRAVTPGGQGALGTLEDLARGRGSTGGLGGILAGAGRFGLIGGAAVLGFQALNELTQSLRVTGDEAFTTQGKISNLGAELLTGNLIGGLKALTATQPAKIVGELSSKIDELKAKSDPLVLTQEKLAQQYEENPEKLRGYLAVLTLQGHISEDTAKKTFEAVEANIQLANSARVAEAAVGDVARAIAAAGTEAAAFGERGAGDFGRGVGGVTAEAAAAAAAGTTFTAGTGGTDVANQIRASITARIRDEDERLQQQLKDAVLVAAQKRATFENLKGTKEAAKAYAELVQANTAVTTIQNQIADNADAAAKAAKAAAEAKAKEAAAAAEQARQDALSARQQSLENQIAKAALTKRKSDDKAAFDAAIDYWRDLARNADNALDREKAEAKVLDLRKRRREALKGEADSSSEDLELLRIENRIAAAGLTRGIEDDKRFTKQLIGYWRERVGTLTDPIEVERARARLIQAQLALKNLSRDTGLSIEVATEELFRQAADQFRRFGSNFAASAEGLLAPQDARGLFAGNVLGPANQATARAQATAEASLNESKKQTVYLQIIAGGGRTKITGIQVPKETQRVVAEIGANVLRGL